MKITSSYLQISLKTFKFCYIKYLFVNNKVHLKHFFNFIENKTTLIYLFYLFFYLLVQTIV